MISVQVLFPSNFRDDCIDIHLSRVPCVGERLCLFLQNDRIDFEIINVIHESFISSLKGNSIKETQTPKVVIEVQPIKNPYIF